MIVEIQDFMFNMFSAQEVECKKDHKEFKEEIQTMIKDGIRTEVEAATKPVKENQIQIMKEHESLMKKVGELKKKLHAIDKTREKNTEFPALLKPKKTIQNNREKRTESVPIDKDNDVVKKTFLEVKSHPWILPYFFKNS